MAVVQNIPGMIPWDSIRAAMTVLRPHVVVFPEYAWYGARDRLHTTPQRYHRVLRQIRARTEMWPCPVIAGSLIRARSDGRLRAETLLLYRGTVLARYVKMNPTPPERSAGVTTGPGWVVWEIPPHHRWIPLICADVFCQDVIVRAVQSARPTAVFVPTASPHRGPEPEGVKHLRDERWFRSLAARLRAPVYKACITGVLFGREFHGRSLVARPDGILWRPTAREEWSPLVIGVSETVSTVWVFPLTDGGHGDDGGLPGTGRAHRAC